MKKNVYLLLAIFFCNISSIFSQTYEPTLEICERYYNDGDYEKALTECNRIVKKLKKESKGYAVANAELYQAKYLEAMGDFVAFEEVLGDALKNKKISGENSIVYGTALLDAAALYLSYSHTQKAEELLLQATKALNIVYDNKGNFTKAPDDLYLRMQTLYVQSRIFINRGQINSFEQMAEALLGLKNRRIASEDTYYDENNQKQLVSLPPTAQKRRQEEYSEVLTWRAEAQILKGDYVLAEKYLAKADAWIKSQLGVFNVAFIRNEYVRTLLFIERGDKKETIRELLEENQYRAEKVLTTVHKLYMAIHETKINDYFAQRNFGKTGYQLWDFGQNASKYFGEERLQWATKESLDAKNKSKIGRLTPTETKSLKENLQKLYTNTVQVPTNHVRRLLLLEQLYEVELATDNFKRAGELAQEIVQAQEKINGKNSLGYYVAQLRVADYLTTFTPNFKDAEKLIQENFYTGVSKLLAPTSRHYADYLRQLSDFYTVTNKLDSAKAQIDKGIALAKASYGEKDVRYALEINPLIKYLLQQGNYNDAYQKIVEVLAIFEENKSDARNNVAYATALTTAANYYATLGLYSSAREALNKANLLNAKSNANIANSEAIDELAFLYIKMEKYKDAEAILNQAITLRLERYGEKSRFLINPYNQRARLFLIEGEYVKAYDDVDKAIKITNEIFGENSLQNVESYTILAEYNAAIGDFDKAKQEISQVIEKQQNMLGKQHIKLAPSLTQLGLIKFYNKENLDAIEKLFREAEEIVANNLGTDNPIYAEALKNLALVYAEGKKYPQAYEVLNNAEQIWQKVYGSSKNLQSAEIQTLLGDIETKRADFNKAANLYTVAAKTIASRFSKEHPRYTAILSRLARMYYIGNDLTKSEKYINEVLTEYKKYINNFFSALSEREKTKYWSRIRSDFEFYVNLAARKGSKKTTIWGSVYDNALLTKPLLISASSKVRSLILASPDSTLKSLYATWEAKKEALTEANSLSPEQQKESNMEPRKIQKEIEDLEKQLLKNEIFREQREASVVWTEVKESLKADENAAEVLQYRYFDKDFTDSTVYLVLIVKPTSKNPEPVFVANGNLLSGNYFKFYKNNIKYSLKDRLSYQRYWKEIDQQLSAKRVYFAGDGAYLQFNPETLLVNDSTYVIDKQNIFLMSTTKDLVQNKDTKKSKPSTLQKTDGKVVLIGNPVFYSSLNKEEVNQITNKKITQLPGAQKEVEEIFKLLKKQGIDATLVLNFEAKEDSLKALVQNPKILHFATHGYFAPDVSVNTDNALNSQRVVNNPMFNSGLLLYRAGELMESNNIYDYNKYPGVLTAFEVLTMRLENTDLVVLSACETGRGEVKVGEGVYGLQRAIMVAGAKAVAMSLFKVSDDATQKLMSYLYSNIFLKNMDNRTAFIEAKKELRKEYKEPLYWGSFVLSGRE